MCLWSHLASVAICWRRTTHASPVRTALCENKPLQHSLAGRLPSAVSMPVQSECSVGTVAPGLTLSTATLTHTLSSIQTRSQDCYHRPCSNSQLCSHRVPLHDTWLLAAQRPAAGVQPPAGRCSHNHHSWPSRRCLPPKRCLDTAQGTVAPCTTITHTHTHT